MSIFSMVEEMTQISKPLFSHAVMGGTFDRLHDGHFLLLSTAFNIAEKVSIGLTSSFYLKKHPKKYNELIYSYNKRLQQLIMYIHEKFPQKKYHIFPIDHPWGPAAERADFDVIIASEETLPTVEKINEKRTQNNLKPLKAVIIPATLSSTGTLLSSTNLRKKALLSDNR